MARPTDNLKSEVIKVRVSAEQAERLRASGNVSEAVRKLIDGNVPQVQTEGKLNPDDYVPRKEYERVLKELEEKNNVPQKTNSNVSGMIAWFGVSEEEFYEELYRSMNEGYITWEGGLVTHDEVDFSRFKDACHEKNVPIEKAIEKCTQMILRS